MGIDWEDILDADGDDLSDVYDAYVARAEERTPYVNPGDYCVGIWRGTTVRFKKTFSNHTFTDEECAKLLAGEVIEFPATTKDGREYIAKGKLENSEYKGHKYVGFKPAWSR